MNDETKAAKQRSIRESYARAATDTDAGCCGERASTSCRVGYGEQELASAPAGADLGLGCGNPGALAALRPGERVLDLGSGGGLDCFLAASRVGPEGSVVGVDMTPEMVARARANARQQATTNVEFRLGEIEHLPVADASVDVILSNCVINLSDDKPQVFREAFRVLAPGGRLAIADVVAVADLPASLRDDLAAHAACVAGAATVADVEAMLRDVGFDQICVSVRPDSAEFIRDWVPGAGVERFVASATIEAVKPRQPDASPGGCCTRG